MNFIDCLLSKRKNMKTLIAALVIAPMWVSAAEITFLNPYPPGGTIDHTVKVLTPELEKMGHKVKTQYYKSCGEALNALREARPNHFLNILSTAYEPGNANAGCVMDARKDQIDLVQGLHGSPWYMCSAPGKQFTAADLQTQSLRIGYVADFVDQAYLSHWLRNLPRAADTKMVPYRGGGEVRRAVQAGDLELWFGSANQLKNFPDSACIGSTSPRDPRGFPALATFTRTPSAFPALEGYNTLWAPKGTVDSRVLQDIKTAVQGSEFQEYLKKNSFLTVDQSGPQLLQQIEDTLSTIK